MNWNRIGHGALATALSAGLGLGTTACSRDYTVAFVYATASTTTTTGVVDGYLVDYQSGALTQLANSPISSGGRNPVTLAAAPSGKYIYVVNHDDSSIVEFAVGTDGKLYPESTYNTYGSFPLSASVDPTGSYLYVADTYRPGYTTALPGPGDISIFPINSDGSLGTVSHVNVGTSPIGITSTQYITGASGNFVYVIDRESSTVGSVLTFAHTTGSAALTLVAPASSIIASPADATILGTTAGVTPTALAVDPTARFLYITDGTSNQLIGYGLGSSGLPIAMVNGPFSTGSYPSSVAIDPRAKYMYVTNLNASSVSAYVIDQATGNPTAANSGTGGTETNPTCVTIEPALGIYVYVSNYNDQTISALQLNPHNGTLTNVQNTPFRASALPSCVVAVANGAHATQVVDR